MFSNETFHEYHNQNSTYLQHTVGIEQKKYTAGGIFTPFYQFFVRSIAVSELYLMNCFGRIFRTCILPRTKGKMENNLAVPTDWEIHLCDDPTIQFLRTTHKILEDN